MNRNNIEFLLPSAVKLIRRDLAKNEQAVESKYFGYINALGGTVTHAGLLQALYWYTRTSDNEERKKIGDMVAELLQIREKLERKEELIPAIEKYYAEKDSRQILIWRNRVLEAGVALKLALRLFHKIKEKDEEHGD